MTHDKLLVTINYEIGLAETTGNGTDTSFLYALRVVVELHKPIKSPSFPEESGICLTCSSPSLNFYEATRYPCPTIQAIEKELGL